MKIEIRADSVEIDGYVNAIERKSKPIKSRLGEFCERIKKGAFKRALERNDNVRILLNHDWNRDLGGTKDGNLELTEDNIGLRARATIKDAETIEKAKRGDLVGWSFGFQDRPDGVEMHDENGITTRDVNDLDLYEVSLLDRTRTPAYEGTLVTVRADTLCFQGAALIQDIEVREIEEPQQSKETDEDIIDYSKWESMISEMKGEQS